MTKFFSNFALNQLESLFHTDCRASPPEFLTQWFWGSLRICIPNEFPGDTDATYTETAL